MSSRCKLVPFQANHATRVMMETFVQLGLPANKLAQVYTAEGMAFTWLVEGTLVSCGGLVVEWPGLCDAWLLLRYQPHGADAINLARTCKRMLPALAYELKARRVQTLVRPGVPVFVRFVEWLGFRLECVKPNYGPHGETFAEYVWFPEGS